MLNMKIKRDYILTYFINGSIIIWVTSCLDLVSGFAYIEINTILTFLVESKPVKPEVSFRYSDYSPSKIS